MVSKYEQHIRNGALGAGPTPPTLVDRFAPKILVGNVLSGDSAVAHSADGFIYIPDPGDGSGITAAIAQLVALGFAADICLRAGTYTRAAGLARYVVPAGCRVWTPGGALIISNDDDNCIFQLGTGASLDALGLQHNGTLAGAGSAIVEAISAAGALRRTQLRNLFVTVTEGVLGALLQGGSNEVASSDFVYAGQSEQGAVAGVSVEGRIFNPASCDVHDSRFYLMNPAVSMGVGAFAVQDSNIVNNRLTLGNTVVPIIAGANTTNCTAALNVSRGSGGTLPSDTGTTNQISPGVNNIWGA